MVNDILDYTKISFEEDLKFVYKKIKLRNLIDNVTEIMRFKAETRNINLFFTLDPNLPQTIFTDPKRLK